MIHILETYNVLNKKEEGAQMLKHIITRICRIAFIESKKIVVQSLLPTNTSQEASATGSEWKVLMRSFEEKSLDVTTIL